MKTCITTFFAWLPVGFLLLNIGAYINADMAQLRFSYSPFVSPALILQPALIGLALSLIIAAIALPLLSSSLTGWRIIYKWYLAIPFGILLILLWLVSLNR